MRPSNRTNRPPRNENGCGSLTVSNATPSWARISSRPGGVFHKSSGSEASIGEYSSVTRRLPAPEPPTVRTVACPARTETETGPARPRDSRYSTRTVGNHRPSRRCKLPGRNQRSRTVSRWRIHPATPALVDPLHGHARQPGPPGVPRAGVLVDDHERASRPEHPANLAADLIERSRRQMLEDLDGDDPVEARRAERQPTGRSAHPIDACRLIRASPPRGRARPPGAPRSAQRPGKPPLAAAQVEDAAAGERPQTLDDPAQPRIVVVEHSLEPPVERIEPGRDDRFVLGDHDALPVRVSSRCFQARTATETPESAQNMKPSTPSRNPCLNT